VRTSGDKSRSEDLPVGGIVTAPLESNEIDHCLVKVRPVGIAALERPARVTAVEYEFRNTLRMFHRVSHADRCALRYAKHRERFRHVGCRYDVFDVTNPPLQREIANIPIGHATATFVVT